MYFFSLRFKYDIKKWLINFDISSVDDLFEREELSCRLSAIRIKIVDGINLYRNMECIMLDSNLYHGFPFTVNYSSYFIKI